MRTDPIRGPASLKLRLVLLVGVALLPAVALLASWHITTRQRSEAEAEAEAPRLLELLRSEQAAHLEGIHQILATLAAADPLSHGGDGCNAIMQRVASVMPSQGVNVVGPDGTIVCSSIPAAVGIDVSARAHIRMAMATGGFAVGEFSRRLTDDIPFLGLALPYDSPAGERLGLVSITVPLDWFINTVGTKPLPPGAIATLADRNGVILARIPTGTGEAGGMLPPEEIAHLRAARSGLVDVVGADGEQRVLAYAPVDEAGQPFYFSVSLNRDIVFAPIDRQTRIGAALIGLCLIGGLVGARLWSWRRIERPIAALIDGARRGQAGDYGVVPRLSGAPAEIQALGHEFARMAQAIEAREKALRDSERQFRHLADHGGALVWVTDAAGSCTYLGASWYAFTGQTPETGLGLGWADAIHPEDRDAAIATYRRAHEHREPYQNEYRLQRADGEYRWLISVAAPLIDEGGTFKGYVGSAIDITEGKSAALVKAASEERLRLAIAAADLHLWTFDFRSRAVTWIEAERPNGRRSPRPEMPIPRDDLLARIHPDDRAAAAAAIRHAAGPQDDGRFHVEYRRVADDGSWRWIMSEGRITFDEDGRPLSSIGLSADITDRRAAQDMLARYQLLSEFTRDIVMFLRPDGTIAEANAAALAAYGHDAAALRGMNVAALCAPDEEAGFMARIEEAQRGSVLAEATHQRRDGTRFPVEASITAAKIAGETLVLAIMRDGTERRQVEERLRQAQRMEAIGQLTGGVAHDFNNLLTIIIGSLDMLTVSLPEQAPAQGMVQAAMTAAVRGSELTKRLLGFARRLPLQSRPFAVDARIETLVPLLRRTLGEAITIELSCQAPLWPALADPSQLDDAILNLAINARDAMPAGGRLIITAENVTLGADADESELVPGDYVVLSVTDTGAGMTADVLARAVDPFFTTKNVGEGTGLGLSMVYGYAKQSGGHFKLRSEVGRGTEARLYLPRAPARSEPRPSRGDRAMALTGGSELILVVEDDPFVRQTTVANLKSLGYSILEAQNGPEALDLLRDNPAIALLFTDVMMPEGMTGFEVAAAAAALRPDLAILLTSGYSEAALRTQQPVSYTVLGKPYRRSELAAAVRRALEDAANRTNGNGNGNGNGHGNGNGNGHGNGDDVK